MTIHVIGNSHAYFFAGAAPGSFGYKLDSMLDIGAISIGPALAYNFHKNHLPKVLSALDFLGEAKIYKKHDPVVLVIGEVDCRWHLPRQAALNKMALSVIIRKTVLRYLKNFLVLKRLGYNISAWAPHPASSQGHCDDEDAPVFGPPELRNAVTLEFSFWLERYAKLHQIPFASITEQLLASNLTARLECFSDYCHLNYQDLALRMRAIEAIKCSFTS